MKVFYLFKIYDTIIKRFYVKEEFLVGISYFAQFYIIIFIFFSFLFFSFIKINLTKAIVVYDIPLAR